MNIIKNIKIKLGEYFLEKEFSAIKRAPRSVNFDAAENIALIFDATDAEEFEAVKKYIKKLKDDKRKVKALGFYDAKNQPASMISKLEYDFFTQKELTWYLKPIDPIIDNFLREPFDILINLSANNKLPLQWIMALSHARLKVGKTQIKYSPLYDIIIEVAENTNLQSFTLQAEKYLRMINPK